MKANRKDRRELIAKALVVAGVNAVELKLAMNRYPDEDPQDAHRMFHCDRSRAGLGALSKRPRKPAYEPRRGIEHHRRKGLDHEGRAYYRLATEADYVERAPVRFDRRPAVMNASVQNVRITFDLRCDVRDDSGVPRTQADRDALARRLLKARWDLRRAVEVELARLRRS